MGNGCICLQDVTDKYKDIELDSLLEEHIKNSNEQIEATNLYNIARYFNEGEKEINTKIEKKKVKRILSHKKVKTAYNNNNNNANNTKYELMLKRILEQKKIERKGPKRRKTLRINNNADIIKIVNEVIDENKKINEQKNAEILKNMNSEYIDSSINRGSILLNVKDKKKLEELSHSRQSYIISNKLFDHKRISNNFEDTEIHNDLEMNNETGNYN
jgi:hypothetical protein